jgi:hypothetical protein
MNAARKGPGPVKPRAKQPVPEQSSQLRPQPKPAPAVCRRCGMPGPVGDDGFCEKCEKALEQACL